jgi:hypothetical protein
MVAGTKSGLRIAVAAAALLALGLGCATGPSLFQPAPSSEAVTLYVDAMMLNDLVFEDGAVRQERRIVREGHAA